MSKTGLSMGLAGARASALLFGIWVVFASPAQADKVGVAAAVNPDAFSSLSGAPQSQVNIGKSIFYNERINTTDSGLVQVLLLDGSTFTVGPGSNLVIDRFVYDPKKGTGQVTASFSKGVMRFVGGKISKNEGGVKVNTPAGALAIRGGISYINFESPETFQILFVFGDYVALQGQGPVFQPGYGYFSNNGRVEKKPFSADDVSAMLAALSNNGGSSTGNQDNSSQSNGFQLTSLESVSELINEAAQTAINDQAQNANNEQSQNTKMAQPPPQSCEELGNCEPPPCEGEACEPQYPSPEAGTPGGYAAGIYDRRGEQETGLLRDVLFDPESNSVSFGVSDGEAILLDFDENGNPAKIFLNDNELELIQDNQTVLTTETDPICEGCDDIQWGRFDAHLNYENKAEGNTNLFTEGWWVAGELTAVGNIDKLATLGATATYSGMAHGTVINNGSTYDASGGLEMNWYFAERNGDLTISNFDNRSYSTGAGGLTQPSLDVNQFGGSLRQTGGPGMASGSVNGSFVNNGSVAAGGVVGNWGVKGDGYQASGVFAGTGTPR